MPCDELRRDFRASQFPPHESSSRILPNRVFDVHDRRHQRDEAQIRLDHGEQSADPTAVACSEDSKLIASLFAQCRDQLAHLHDALAQAFSISNQVGSDRELAIPATAWNSRVMIGQMNKARVPTELVESRCPAPVTDVRGRHQRVEHDNGWPSSSTRRWEEIGAGNVVSFEFCLNWAAPRNCCAISSS